MKREIRWPLLTAALRLGKRFVADDEALRERAAHEPAHEVLWLGTERLGRLGLLDLLQLCRLVPGGPDPVDSLTLALVRP